MRFVDKSQLESWGTKASQSYLSGDSSLNDSIIKIASDNSLNKEQVKRVAEFSNIITNLEMFEKEADKRFEFVQADSEQIWDSIDSGQEKTASASGHYDFAPEDYRKLEADFEKLAEAKEEESEEYTQLELLDLYEKTSEAIKEMKSEKLAAETECEMAEDDIYFDIKQAVLSGDFTFKEASAICLEHGSNPHSKRLIKEALLKAGHTLVEHDNIIEKSEVTKLASAASDDYIADVFDSPGAPVMIRNGNLNLYYTLDTLVDQADRVATYDKPLLHLNDSVKYVKRKLVSY